MNSDIYFKENTVEKLLAYMSNHEKNWTNRIQNYG